MTYIISYDIQEDRIRAKLARFLEDKGTRLQKSVFAIDIKSHGLKAFLRKVTSITGGAGKVAVFRICLGCERSALQIGTERQRTFHIY